MTILLLGLFFSMMLAYGLGRLLLQNKTITRSLPKQAFMYITAWSVLTITVYGAFISIVWPA